jgi:hypothetical protein
MRKNPARNPEHEDLFTLRLREVRSAARGGTTRVVSHGPEPPARTEVQGCSDPGAGRLALEQGRAMDRRGRAKECANEKSVVARIGASPERGRQFPRMHGTECERRADAGRPNAQAKRRGASPIPENRSELQHAQELGNMHRPASTAATGPARSRGFNRQAAPHPLVRAAPGHPSWPRGPPGRAPASP